jgi:hypothetical protein
MTVLRALLLGSIVSGLLIAVCGGAGSGGTTGAPNPSAAPALGTNSPPSPAPTKDPYDYGY